MPELISTAYRHCDLGHSWNESEHGDHQCPVCGRGVLASDDQIPQQQMHPRGWLAWRVVGWGIALLLPTFLWGYWLWTKHTAHIGSAYAVALSPSGSQLWTGGVDGTVREWNMDSHSVVSTWPVLDREVPIAMAASSTGHLAIITAPLDSLGLPDSDHSQLFLRRTDGGKWKVVSECVQPHSFRWSGDGKRLAVINDSSVTIIDPSQGRATLQFVATTREEGHLRGVAFVDATGARVATCSARNVKLWDSETGEFLTCPITFRETGRSVDISPDGRWIVAGGRHHSAIGELHLQRLEQADGSDDRDPIQASSEISQVAFVDDQHFLAVESLGGTQLFDVSSGKVVAELPTGSQQPSVSVNLDRRLMAVPERNNVGLYSIKDDTIAQERSLAVCVPQPVQVMGTVAPLVWGLVAVAMPIPLLLARRHHARQEANVKMAVQEANTKLAMIYSPTCTPWLSDRLLAPDALEIGSNHTLWHTLQGKCEGHEQIVAWHCWWRSPRAGYGDDSARYSRIINVFPDAFPKDLRFSLTPNAFPGQAEMIRRKSVESPLESHADERFAANYRLSNAENEAVRELFSKNVIEWFANHPGWIVKCSNGVFLTAFDSWKSIKQVSKNLSAEVHPNPTCQSIVDLAESSREILALMRPS